jgi:feruloyl esterase
MPGFKTVYWRLGMKLLITRRPEAVASAVLVLLLGACGGTSGPDNSLPQLGAATGTTIKACDTLASSFTFANTTVTAAAAVAAGTLTFAGAPIGPHCRVAGNMFSRTSSVDGRSYAIGFEMRLPNDWNGRYFYQANGGLDGTVVTATGTQSGSSALAQGFAVISSDAGHAGSLGPLFGIDPQARLDYGYQAVGKLTPMAKSLVQAAYGKGPDRSYIGGCSNGGRHTMIAASRYADQYDGFLVGDPGFRLPLAAIANIAAGKGWASFATNPSTDISTGFTQAERSVVARAVLGRCDALDGVNDGLIQDTKACQATFDLNRDVPTCAAARDGTCLSAAQKQVVAKRYAGHTTETGTKIYVSFPYDSGVGGGNTPFWFFTAPPNLDSGNVAFVLQVPPEDPATFSGPTFMLTGNLDSMLTKIQQTNGTYTESALSFMLPPNPSNLSALKNRGAKMILYHGTSDPIFSSDDTQRWYDELRAANGGSASDFARYFPIHGMTHCNGGPSTDAFDALTPLVAWVERGEAPERILASVRGVGSPLGTNADIPSDWSQTRTRPLCPYPAVARFSGGSTETAASFVCQ